MSLAPLLNAAKLLPSSLVIKGLEKINPSFKNYFSKALAYGFDTNRALDFLVGKFGNPNKENEYSRLRQGSQEGNLRPDEMVSLSSMESERIPGKLARGAASIGGGALFAGMDRKEEAKNEPINADFSMSREDPTVPKQKTSSKVIHAPESPTEDFSSQVMQQFLNQYPELAKFLDSRINKGIDPIQAATEAKQHKKLRESVERFEARNGPLEDALAFLFRGNGQQQRQTQGQQQGSGNKVQFMKGLGDLAKMMQSLKR